MARAIQTGPQTGGPQPPSKALFIPSHEEQQVLAAASQALITDLSKLGNSGDRFVHEFFMPSNQLTFPAYQVQAIATLLGVAGAAPGLTPCLQEAARNGELPAAYAPRTGPPAPGPSPTKAPPPDAATLAKIQAVPLRCMRMHNFQEWIIIPERTIRQVLKPPATDITSTSYTIAGVDPATPDIALITRAQVTSGNYLSADKREAILSDSYAQRKTLAVGLTFDLNGKSFEVVGLAKPPLGQAADVYLPLTELQSLASRPNRVNLIVVRARSAADIDRLTKDGLVVRQVVMESLLQGAIGGLLGVALGIGAAYSLAAFVPPLEASVPPQVAATSYFFGRGMVATGPEDLAAKAAAVARVPFEAPINRRIVLLARRSGHAGRPGRWRRRGAAHRAPAPGLGAARAELARHV